MTLYEALDRFGADGMRFCLADSGDSIEDANFVITSAEAGILRLYAYLEWVKKFCEEKDSYRSEQTEENYQFQDDYFEK